MVLPAAKAFEVKAWDVSATDKAATDRAAAIVGRFQRVMWNIRFSPDVKPVKDR
jgi:hypothetical protein